MSRAEKKRQTRKALLTAAGELIAELGVRSTTLEAVAERAGLHVQTLYRHFANKSELFAAIEEEAFEAQRALLEDPARTDSTIDVRLKMDLETIRGLHSQGVGRALTSLSDPELAGVHMLMADRYVDLLSESLAEEMGLKPDDPEPRLVASMLQWGSFSVLKALSLENKNSDAAVLAAYKQAFARIEEVFELFSSRETSARNSRTS